MLRFWPQRRKSRHPAVQRGGSVRLERLEPRHLLAADSIGITPGDTGEFLLGTVRVTPVFFDSTGETDTKTQHWSDEVDEFGRDEIDQVMARLSAGLQWWVDTLDTLGTNHKLEFDIDRTFVDTPFPTAYEPIDRNGIDFNLYVTEFLRSNGQLNPPSIEAGVRAFNHAQRSDPVKGETDWAFTIFIVDASDDVDDFFAPGTGHRGAFAFAGGLFYVIPSTRDPQIFAHELGHIFWAMDEYPSGHSWNDSRGYYDTQNLNGTRDNPDPGFDQQDSIMLGFQPLQNAFDQHVSPAATLATVGWQDSDGDGIFDVADVPLDLTATGYFDAASGQYHLSGTASAVPLMNRNPSGFQSDITFNRVSQIQFRLDGGDWITADQPNQPVVEIDLKIPVDDPFDVIQWRAIDTTTGVTSPIVTGTSLLPAQSSASLSGVAFVDHNSDTQRGAGEELLEQATVTVRHADDTPLFYGNVHAADFDDGLLPLPLPEVTFAVEGEDLSSNVGSFVSADAGNRRVLHNYEPGFNRWSADWRNDDILGASFDQPVGQVTLEVVGVRDGGFGRIEAYDALGQLIGRATTGQLNAGEVESVSVTDGAGRIASIRAFAHADSVVGFAGFTYGHSGAVVTDASGTWSVDNLADGEYVVEIVPERVVHHFAVTTFNVQVSGGTSETVIAAAERVDSIRHNAALPYDATGTDGVTSLDALVIINDIGRYSSRVLQPAETEGFHVDVNNDGIVSALDALLVINHLGEQDSGDAEAGSPVHSVAQAQMFNSADRAVERESSLSRTADRDDRREATDHNDSAASQWPPGWRQSGRLGAPTTSPLNNEIAKAELVDGDDGRALPAGLELDPSRNGAEFGEPFNGYEV